MSVDIAWSTITSGPDGEVLAENIRDFVHTKFQQITLPRFIKSVQVHSFDFGSACPEIEIKDICDPLPDFYEDDDDEDEDQEDDQVPASPLKSPATHQDGFSRHDTLPTSAAHAQLHHQPGLSNTADIRSSLLHRLNTGASGEIRPTNEGYFNRQHHGDMSMMSFPRSGTPGIPGGTSNLSYFHLPMGGLSGTQTPLAAVASGTPYSVAPSWHQSHFPNIHHLQNRQGAEKYGEWDFVDPSSRPSTADTLPSPREPGSPFNPSSPENQPLMHPTAEKVSDDPTLEARTSPSPLRLHPNQPSDLQVVARVQYSGDVRMTLTAEILLDYPMPSFVGIPLKLSITGMTFDGVAVLAYTKKKMHFCFLDPEDAEALVGEHILDDQSSTKPGKASQRMSLTGLLKEINVESEIGRQESGKQVLKNVGKVEKFVLEQVRRIFEEEFVFPSFWTFLV